MDALTDAIGKLSSAALQLSPRDDQIIAEHVRDSVALLLRHREQLRALKPALDSRMNDYLCEMQEGYDDSIVGFNEAWDVMRKFFAEKIVV